MITTQQAVQRQSTALGCSDAGARGEAPPGWLRRSTDRRLPASRLEDSQIQRAYPITPGPYCGHSLQL
jgi:hypothetical protein